MHLWANINSFSTDLYTNTPFNFILQDQMFPPEHDFGSSFDWNETSVE